MVRNRFLVVKKKTFGRNLIEPKKRARIIYVHSKTLTGSIIKRKILSTNMNETGPYIISESLPMSCLDMNLSNFDTSLDFYATCFRNLHISSKQEIIALIPKICL